jgi:hypothetical protein
MSTDLEVMICGERKITLFVGDALDYQFAIQAKVGER